MKKLITMFLMLAMLGLFGLMGCVEPACVHQFSEWQTTQPTCLDAGENKRTCTLCGGVESEAIPAIGHNYKDGICLNCGGGTDACRHEFDEWRTITPATCEAEGEKQRVCSTCKSVEKTAIPALGHTYNDENICIVCSAVDPNTFLFEENETGYTFVGIDTFSGTEITIPSTYNGKPVTAIKENAFYNNKTITSVSVPHSVAYIGKFAFYHCSKLETIVLPDKLECDIGDNTFYGCAIKQITIPNGVTSIGNYAFCFCSNLTSVTIPNSVTSIGNSAFANCNSLSSITIPDSVASIGSYAFYNCDGLINVCCPILAINYLPILNLKSVVITSGECIDNEAFYNCSSLMSVVIRGNVTAIGNSAFEYCSSLTTFEMSSTVTSIGCRAFYGCSRLTSIEIPNGVTSINSEAFYGCRGLTEVIIPDSVTIIQSSAFSYCSMLTTVVISENVTSIGYDAFCDCYSLTSVVIGSSTTSIGSRAFDSCTNLTNVYYKGTESDWAKIAINNNSPLTNATRYYYCETEPTEEGNYWHYVDGVPTAW